MFETRKVLHLKEGIFQQKETKTKSPDKQKTNSENKVWQIMSLASGLGFSISIPIVAGALVGKYLDEKLNSSPRITLSLIFLGLFFGIYNFYKALKETEDN